MPTRSQKALETTRWQFDNGADHLAAGASSYGRAGHAGRELLLRLTRHLSVRQRAMDEQLVGAVSALAFETSVAHLAASSFPESLDPSAVLDVETDVGPLYLHAADEVMTPMIAAHRSWEASEARFLQQAIRPGATVLDVGANIGYFSVLAARAVGADGSVIAVEPEQRNLALLKANLWRNGCDNVVVIPVAAGSSRGFLPLRHNEENRGDHQTDVAEGADRLVPSAPLDELLQGRRIDVIKVDTQGYDHEVLAGLAQTIRASRPAILSEFWFQGLRERGLDPGSVAEGFRQAGYTLRLLDDQGDLEVVSPQALVDAAAGHPSQYVNVVLTLD